MTGDGPGVWETAAVESRLDRARAAMGTAGIDVLLVSPGTDLRYLTGYDALPLERLTCLVLPVAAEPFLVVPRLELPAAQAALAEGGPDLELVAYDETDDPYALVARRLPPSVRVAGLDDHMWAAKVLAFRAAMSTVEQTLAGRVLRELRMRKSPEEVASLRRAASAIDEVHAQMGQWLRPGRTEREVAADIRDAIVAAGHATAEFAIVASGPNAASPHHEAADRVIQPGDVVVVDIGGRLPDGYCSDSTRTYAIGEPPAAFAAYYEVLQAAQEAQVTAVRPGLSAAALDAVGRDMIAAAGYGEYFVHRTGHGIGLDVHEEPYIVADSDLALEPGMAFSIEPGIYLPGRHGARIEDIVVCTVDGAERLNRTDRSLAVL